MGASIIPPLTAADFVKRIAASFPNGWASQIAAQTGNLYALWNSLAQGPAFEITAEQYALAASRVQTAIDDALDLLSAGFGCGRQRHPRTPQARPTRHSAIACNKACWGISSISAAPPRLVALLMRCSR